MDDRPTFKCKRCGRLTILRREEQEYGRKCAKKLAGHIQIDSQALVSGKVLRKGKCQITPIYARDEKGEVTAVIL